MLRVFLAASMSIFSNCSSAGGMISRSFCSFIQRVFTPIELRTSIMRLTSSIRATRRRTVLPLLRSEAQSRPTAAFFEVLISISPWSS